MPLIACSIRQVDRKIIAAGVGGFGSSDAFGPVLYNTDGSLDSGLGAALLE
ncbi:hypothetical protein AB0E67_34995 [Streptomyces sp. NPDC032161]|uniref:hypothetical protein n=1 Tax=unclassified Streptomyces TaxID=2593676 RepID=UPI0033E7ABA7